MSLWSESRRLKVFISESRTELLRSYSSAVLYTPSPNYWSEWMYSPLHHTLQSGNQVTRTDKWTLVCLLYWVPQITWFPLHSFVINYPSFSFSPHSFHNSPKCASERSTLSYSLSLKAEKTRGICYRSWNNKAC